MHVVAYARMDDLMRLLVYWNGEYLCMCACVYGRSEELACVCEPSCMHVCMYACMMYVCVCYSS
jgi:hypothetical protein